MGNRNAWKLSQMRRHWKKLWGYSGTCLVPTYLTPLIYLCPAGGTIGSSEAAIVTTPSFLIPKSLITSRFDITSLDTRIFHKPLFYLFCLSLVKVCHKSTSCWRLYLLCAFMTSNSASYEMNLYGQSVFREKKMLNTSAYAMWDTNKGIVL